MIDGKENDTYLQNILNPKYKKDKIINLDVDFSSASMHIVCSKCKTEFKQTYTTALKEYYDIKHLDLGMNIAIACPKCKNIIKAEVQQINYKFTTIQKPNRYQ